MSISRALDPGEAFFFLSDHVSCMNFVVLAERSGSLAIKSIRDALDRLQQENALLQVRIAWTEELGLRFEPAPGHAIELLCHQSSLEDWQSLIEQQLSSPFPTGSAPLMRCLYLQIGPAEAPALSAAADAGAKSCVLALCFHHSIADGRSGTELLRRLLALIAQDGASPTGSSSANSASASPTHLPSMAELMPAAYRWTEQPDAARALRSTLLGDYRRHGALAPLPWLATQASGRKPQLIRLELDAQTSAGLLDQARAHNTTVHGALCAAQLLAQYRLQPDPEPAVFFLSCPVDMRAHLEGQPALCPTGFLTSLISGVFKLGADTEIWALAKEVVTQTRLQLARGEGHLLYHLYGLDGSPLPPQALEPFRKKAMASLPNTMVSNLGAVALVAEDPAVQAISFALCPMPYQTLFTAASSYAGRLILNVAFDAERLTPATARTLVQHMAEILQASSQPNTEGT